MLRFFIACLLLAGCADAASGASFDCTKAGGTVEKLICADPALSKADEALTEAYKAALAASLSPDEVKSAQIAWLKARNQAPTGPEMLKLMEARTVALRGLADQARTERRASGDIASACLAVATEVADLVCKVEQQGTIVGDPTKSLRFQTHALRAKDGDQRIGTEVVVLTPVVGTPQGFEVQLRVVGDNAYLDSPFFVATSAGPLLVVPGREDGTANGNAERLYLYKGGTFEAVDDQAWQEDLAHRMPKNMGVYKGIYPDYDTMTAVTAVWNTSHDPNCCPTGGRATIKLAIEGHRLVMTGFSLERGEAAARNEDIQPIKAAAQPSTSAATSDILKACGKPVAFDLDRASFDAWSTQRKEQRLATIKAKLPPLIVQALDRLCAKGKLTPTMLAKRVKRIVLQYAEGADSVAAYFPDGKADVGKLVVQWVWNDASPEDLPAVDDIQVGLACGFDPKSKGCDDREP